MTDSSDSPGQGRRDIGGFVPTSAVPTNPSDVEEGQGENDIGGLVPTTAPDEFVFDTPEAPGICEWQSLTLVGAVTKDRLFEEAGGGTPNSVRDAPESYGDTGVPTEDFALG